MFFYFIFFVYRPEVFQVTTAGSPVATQSTMLHVWEILEPQTSIYKWLFQLDGSNSLHRKWLEITKRPFKAGCLEKPGCHEGCSAFLIFPTVTGFEHAQKYKI